MKPAVRIMRSVLDCGDSLPLFPGATQSSDESEHSKAWRVRPWLLCFIILHSAFCLSVHSQTNYTVLWDTLDGAEGVSTGGVYTVTDTVGQPDAGRMTGGNYSVDGGFWGVIATVQTPGSPPLSLRRNLPLNTLTLAWPYPSTGYGLQINTNLNGITWLPATNVPVHVSAEWQIILIPPTLGSMDESYCEYYRLFKP